MFCHRLVADATLVDHQNARFRARINIHGLKPGDTRAHRQQIWALLQQLRIDFDLSKG